jgi:hypothetical protein
MKTLDNPLVPGPSIEQLYEYFENLEYYKILRRKRLEARADQELNVENIQEVPRIGGEMLDLVLAWYPEFKTDLELLEKVGYFENNGDSLKWEKSKQSLAEYFGNQSQGNNRW